MADAFLNYRVWQTSQKNVYGSTRYSDGYCTSCMSNSIGRKTSFETNISKKGYHPVRQKTLAYFSLVLSNMTIVKEQFITVHKVLLQFLCKLQLDCFLGHKKLIEPNFFKIKAIVPVKKSLSPIFSHITDHRTSRVIFCQAPHEF